MWLCLSSKTEKTAKILEIFSKFKKPKIWVLGNVIMKANVKSQEASSIGNSQKSYRGVLVTHRERGNDSGSED